MNLVGITRAVEDVLKQKRESLVWINNDFESMTKRKAELESEIENLEKELEQLKKK
jgi:predicted  nucleic acid-binding Zn-ribbon protein